MNPKQVLHYCMTCDFLEMLAGDNSNDGLSMYRASMWCTRKNNAKHTGSDLIAKYYPGRKIRSWSNERPANAIEAEQAFSPPIDCPYLLEMTVE